MDREHHRPTKWRNLRYTFTHKHHGGHGTQWIVGAQEEFAVFEGADEHRIEDNNGNMFGVLKEGADSLRDLADGRQQIAQFPWAPEGQAWHGYPMWPLEDEADSNRRNAKRCPREAL